MVEKQKAGGRTTGPLGAVSASCASGASCLRAQDLRQRVRAWAVKLRVNPRVIRVQDMRSKWGSCSSLGTVTLAADLIGQAEAFQDYVIVHELLHLRVSQHGRVFTALMTAYVPGWRQAKLQGNIRQP